MNIYVKRKTMHTTATIISVNQVLELVSFMCALRLLLAPLSLFKLRFAMSVVSSITCRTHGGNEEGRGDEICDQRAVLGKKLGKPEQDGHSEEFFVQLLLLDMCG